jgi:tetratricopeptide (TPR) repeat protein
MQTGRVFVSHTSDMARWPAGRSYVQAALDAVVRADMVPVDMRYFAARDGKPADYCRRRVRECDTYIAVVGFRYGSIVPGTAVSYTELEFREAGAARLARLVFLLADGRNVPDDLTDADHRAAYAFRQRLRAAGLIVREFASDDNLELEVFHALTNLGDGARPVAPEMNAPVRYSLPSDTAVFTGRDKEVDLITRAVSAAAGRGVVMIYAIDGMPGLGKTALAIHAAHLLRPQFPDRQLFIDLHGHTPGQQPVSPEAALAGLLAVVGVDARSLPADLEGRQALWRDRMAGQQTLLVLDNAASSQQVAPLLPGDGNCLVLVTSRRHLGDLPGAVVPVMLDALTPDAAQEMFRRLAPRAASDPAAAAVQQLVQLAGFLPLAISLLARVYLRHPSWTIADLIRETQASLLTLTAEAGSIAAAFGVSYRSLTVGQQEFFRVLGLAPGTTIDAYAVAALAGIPVSGAGRQLDALHGEGLLTEPAYRRYGMHDLIRAYSRHCIAENPVSGSAQMLTRLLDYYQHTAAHAEAQLARQTRVQSVLAAVPAPADAPDLADRMQALAWLRAERANLLASLDHATRTGCHARVVALTSAMAALLRQDGPWSSAITRHETAVTAARQLGDRPGEASALIDLGTLLHLTGDTAGAVAALEQALGSYDALGDRLGQANALTNLGELRRRIDDYPGATAALNAALGRYRDLDDLLGQAKALTELGVVRKLAGDFPGAAASLETALCMFRELGDVPGQADSIFGLGAVHRHTGHYSAASQALTAALGMYCDLGDRLGQANTLSHLGAVRRETPDYPAATAALVEALRIHQDLGNRSGQAVALEYLGTVRRLTGDFPGADRALTTALGIFRDIGDRGGEIETLDELGALHRLQGGLALAVTCHREALRGAREISSAWDEAHALAGLARCDLAAGQAADAETKFRQAYQMFQRMGAAETPGVAAELDALAGEGTV